MLRSFLALAFSPLRGSWMGKSITLNVMSPLRFLEKEQGDFEYTLFAHFISKKSK